MNFKRYGRDDSGFTLVELIIAVSILIILTGGGVLLYNNIMNDRRQSAIELASQTVMNDAMSYVMDFDDNTNSQMAVDEWNDSGSNYGFMAEIIIESREVSVPSYVDFEYRGDKMVVQDCVNIRLYDDRGFESVSKNDKLCGIED